MTKEELLLAQKEFLFPSVFHYFKDPLVVSHAKDQYVWDIDGNQYLDFFGGIVTVSVGHCNDQVNQKVHAQIDKLEHVSTVFATEPQVALAQKLATLTPNGAPAKNPSSPTAAPKPTKPPSSPPAATPVPPKSSPCATPITADPQAPWDSPGRPPGNSVPRRRASFTPPAPTATAAPSASNTPAVK